jgi:uroporphyrinogen decarboxylase
VFAELDIPQDTMRYANDTEWRLALNKAYNDKSEQIVGRRLLDESRPDSKRPRYPPIKELYHIFEMENRWDPISQSYWLHPSANGPDELAALLDRVDGRLDNLRAFLLPPDWEFVKERLMPLGIRPPLYRSQRGPVTFATSLYGAQELIYLIADEPELAGRLRDAIRRAMLEKIRIHDEEAGYIHGNAPRGFSFADDNCALLNAEMYAFFGYPIVKAVWDYCSPDEGDPRYQHSDSDMAHILPVLAQANLTAVNFGPTVLVDTIRAHMPRAVIHGVLAPFTYSRNDEVGIVAEFLRDFDMAREGRGIVFATAGSINNGSRLTGMRLLMAAIQEYGRYDS